MTQRVLALSWITSEKKPDQSVLDFLAKRAPTADAEDEEADVLVMDDEEADEEEEGDEE